MQDAPIPKRRLSDILAREYSLNGARLTEWLHSFRNVRKSGLSLAMNDLELVRRNGFVIGKDAPEIIAKGTHQIVLDLDKGHKSPLGYLAKVRVLPRQSSNVNTHLVSPEDMYVTATGYEPGVINGVELFKDIGKILSVKVADHSFYDAAKRGFGGIIIKDRGSHFAIVPDLSESGRYKVCDVDNVDIKSLPNGVALENKLENCVDYFAKIYDATININKKSDIHYRILLNGHVNKRSTTEAFRHLFFVRYSYAEDFSDLVLGDLDHVYLYRR